MALPGRLELPTSAWKKSGSGRNSISRFRKTVLFGRDAGEAFSCRMLYKVAP
jgi:hypothetical protein